MANAKPAAEVRIGAIKGVIWRNVGESTTRHNVVFQRIYKDGDTWKVSHNFGRDDLLVLSKLVDLAHSRILELQSEPKGG